MPGEAPFMYEVIIIKYIYHNNVIIPAAGGSFKEVFCYLLNKKLAIHIFYLINQKEKLSKFYI